MGVATLPRVVYVIAGDLISAPSPARWWQGPVTDRSGLYRRPNGNFEWLHLYMVYFVFWEFKTVIQLTLDLKQQNDWIADLYHTAICTCTHSGTSWSCWVCDGLTSFGDQNSGIVFEQHWRPQVTLPQHASSLHSFPTYHDLMKTSQWHFICKDII